MCGSPCEAAKYARTWRRFLRRDVAPLVLHRQAIVQSFKHIHSCSGIGRPVRAGQQLQGAPAVSDRVVPGDSAPVLEAQDPLQTHPFVHCAIGDFRLLRGHLEAFVEAWKEVLQHSVGVIDGSRTRKSEFADEPVLERSCGAFHSTLRLRRQSEDKLHAELVHCSTELSGAGHSLR